MRAAIQLSRKRKRRIGLSCLHTSRDLRVKEYVYMDFFFFNLFAKFATSSYIAIYVFHLLLDFLSGVRYSQDQQMLCLQAWSLDGDRPSGKYLKN